MINHFIERLIYICMIVYIELEGFWGFGDAAAAMYHRSALVKVGGFDEDYFCYHEDVDLAFRLRLQGYKCWYEPRAVVNHVGSGITGKRSVFSTYHGHRNLVWTFFKNMPTSLLLIYLPWHLIMTITAIFISSLRGQGLIVIRAKLDALKAYKTIFKKRASIQKSRTVGSFSLLPLMDCGVISFIKR
jgi:GT2 family glycosyltransferase